MSSQHVHAHAAATAALVAGHLSEARRLVAEGLAEAVEPGGRAQLVRLQARLSTWSGPVSLEAWAEVVGAAEQVAAQDPALAAALLCDAAVLAAFTRQLPLAEQLAGRALDLSGGEGAVGALAATDLGIAYGLIGRVEEAAPLLARSQELLDADCGVAESAELLLHVVLALVVQERYDEAVDAASRFLTVARALQAVGLLPLPLCLLAHAAWKAGRWEEGRLSAAEALSVSLGTGEPALELYANAMLALVAGARGREAACRERVARTLELSDETGIGMFRVTVHMSLVHLALGQDRPADALAPLAVVAGLMGEQRRVGMLNWHADHVDALVQLGRPDEAAPLVDLLVRDGATSRWEAAAALRCRGQLEPDDEPAVALLRRSVDAFAWQPYEQARSRLRLAQRLHAAGMPGAAEEAAQARSAFEDLRAVGWAAQAAAVHLTEAPVVPGPQHAAAFEVRVLGGFGVLRAGQPVALAAGAPTQAVKYVAIRGGRAPADDLVEALWPGAEPGRGRTRLRNVLARLRRDADLLVRDGDDVVLCPGAVCDAGLFLAEAEQALAGDLAVARRAVARYDGELLPADRYLDWTARARERLRGRYLQLLDRLAADAADRGEVDAAVGWFEQALEVDRFDEDRYLALAVLLAEEGRAGSAHRVVRRAYEALERLGVRPSARLDQLAASLGA